MTHALLDREAELAAFEWAAQAVAAGAGRAVLVEGGPGAGKTLLLGEARSVGVRAGLSVLAARGGEMEREHPYGIVRQLFEAQLSSRDGGALLEGPAAAASSVFRPETAVEAAPFATLNGLYWLVASAAAEKPLMLVVDDLQWADLPSLGFLRFLVRRMEGLPILLVLAGRPADLDVLADIRAGLATKVLRPAPLSESATSRLAAEILGAHPAEGFAAACRRCSGGNPLLLAELLRALRAEGVAPDGAHIDAVEALAPSALGRVVLARLQQLPADALAVAQAIAVLGTGAAAPSVADLAGIGESAVSPAVEVLIEAEILDPEPPLGFVGQVVRDAVYHELTPDERDRRHTRAAEVLHAQAAEPDQVGAHLLLAAPRGAAWAVDALRAAATDAAQRGATETAITFLRRALAERPADAGFELLFRLGMAEAAIEPAAAIEHLRAAHRTAPDHTAGARVGELITRLLVFTDPSEAVLVARRALVESPEDAQDLRAALSALEHYAARFTGQRVTPYGDPAPESSRVRMQRAVQAWERALSGGTAEECAALAADVLGLADTTAGGPGAVRTTLFTAMVASSVLIFADDPRAQAFWDDWHTEAVRDGRAHAVIASGVWHGLTRLRLGRLDEAEASLREALEGPPSWGPGTEAAPAHTLSVLAEVLVERGDLAGAEATLARVPESLSPFTEGALLCRCAEVRLRVAQGRPAEALAASDAFLDRLRTVLNPAWAPWRSLRAEALAQLGRRDEALAAAGEELELARRWGTPGPIGRALIVVGQLEERLDTLEEAVAITRAPLAQLEHAKALLALGGAVRRSRRPGDARSILRDAHDLAVACGAGALAGRVREELAAAGGRARTVSGTGAASLTHSERRVAELAAAGRRNREIAQQLFLSLKTVEVHLSRSYRKLGIRRREELPEALNSS